MGASWRIISSIEQKEENKGNAQHVDRIKSYRKKVEDELKGICDDILGVLKSNLIPSALASRRCSTTRCRVTTTATWQSSWSMTSAPRLPREPSRPTRLRRTLPSQSCPRPTRSAWDWHLTFRCYYEILNSPDRACQLAKQAFDDAIAELDTLSEESYKDSTLIMQLLRDNLTLWTSDQGDDGGSGGDGTAVEDL